MKGITRSEETMSLGEREREREKVGSKRNNVTIFSYQ